MGAFLELHTVAYFGGKAAVQEGGHRRHQSQEHLEEHESCSLNFFVLFCCRSQATMREGVVGPHQEINWYD